MKSPNSPNPYKVADAQASSNLSTAMAQSLLNQVNQVTPYGSLTYSQSGTSSYYDPTTKRTVKIPRYTATTDLTPEQRGLLDQEQRFDKMYNDIALRQTGAIGEHLATPFKYDQGDYEQWAGDLYGKLNNDTNARNADALEQRLKNQGLSPGSAAYDDAMRNLTYSQDKARNAFMLDAYDTGFNKALTERNQPINEISALMNGGSVQQPQFVNTPQTGVNGTDIAGLVMNNYAQQNANYQAKLGGIAGLGAAVAGGWAMSDRRAKKDAKKVGKLNDGTDIYAYRYKDKFGGGGMMQLGVMAQEAAKRHPGAVRTGADGYKRVNYSRIAEDLA